MYRYLAKRILWTIPTLVVISMIMFWLSRLAPGHPVDQLFDLEQIPISDQVRRAADFRQKAALLGLDKAPFYFQIQAKAEPDTFYRVFPPDVKEAWGQLIAQCGDAELSQTWMRTVYSINGNLDQLPDSICPVEYRQECNQLISATHLPDVEARVLQMAQIANAYPNLHASQKDLESALYAMAQSPKRNSFAAQLPKFVWHGMDNQYHHWFKNMLSGYFGTSYKNRRPVTSLLTMRFQRTICIGLISILFAFAIAIPAGVLTSRKQKPLTESKLIKSALFIYAVPVFWLGSLLILLFATPFAGMNLFRFGCGMQAGDQNSAIEWVFSNFSCLILPISCLTLHIAIGIFLQMRTSMHQVLQQDFIRMARAKGLDEKKVLWRHAFPNAIFPIVTMLGGVFTFIVAGSVVIEYLFDIPGLGTALHEAFFSRDYPVLFALLMLYAVTIVVGNLLADLLYALLDPRVRYQSQKH